MPGAVCAPAVDANPRIAPTARAHIAILFIMKLLRFEKLSGRDY
jgi:hypothetical protein